MKKMNFKSGLWVFLASLILFLCPGCGAENAEENAANPFAEPSVNQTTRSEQFSQDEYVLYQNIFYNGYGKDWDGVKVEKTGVFAAVRDAFNDRQRYYVWGYYDQSKCCDWQWEFVPKKGKALPSPGSLIKISGTFSSHENALDGYWISDAEIQVKTPFDGQSAELDMLSMSCTLERVQMINILRNPSEFQGKEFLAYGRIASPNSLEDPYFDNSWNAPFKWDGAVPGTGTPVAVAGFVEDGVLVVRTLDNL